VAILVIIATTLGLVGATVVIFVRARKAARSTGTEDLVSRADSKRYLAENWTLVEKSARESGMTDEEIARVRANVLGAP
jgi:hypothetical protein